MRLPSSDGNPTDPVWLEHTWQLTDADGLPVEIAVQDLVETESVGYRYDDVKPPAEIAGSLTGVGVEAAGAVTIDAPKDGKANVLIGDPLTKRLTAGAQAPIIQALAAEDPKVVVLRIENLEVPQGLPTIYRFFLNRPYADAFTEATRENGYVGNLVLVPLAGEEVQPRMTVRVMLAEGVLQDIAAHSENSITIVPVGIDVPRPNIRIDFEKLALSVGE